jgi:hypothetical protein
LQTSGLQLNVIEYGGLDYHYSTVHCAALAAYSAGFLAASYVCRIGSSASPVINRPLPHS